MLSVKDTLAFWAGLNGCSSPKEEHFFSQVADGTAVIKITYQCTKNPVVLYSIEGGGHAWPPSEGAFSRVTGKSSKNLDATKVTWDFFKTYTR